MAIVTMLGRKRNDSRRKKSGSHPPALRISNSSDPSAASKW